MHEERNESLDSSTLDETVELEKPGDDSLNVRIRPPGNGETFDVEVSDRESSWLTENSGLTGDTDLKLQITERWVRVRVSTAGSGGTSDVLLSAGGAE